MSGPLEKLSPLLCRFREASPSIFKKSRHSELWGVDLKHAERHTIDLILIKFLKIHSTIPALQLPRARGSLEKNLTWRRTFNPREDLAEAESILPDLDLCHVTSKDGQYVLWVSVDERTIKDNSPIHDSLMRSPGLVKLGLAVMEKLSTLLLSAATSSDKQNHLASCVIEFKLLATPNGQKGREMFSQYIHCALERLATCIRQYYPSVFGTAYIINPSDDYLANLDIDETLLNDTVLLNDPEDLHKYLGSQIPSRYGGSVEFSAELDFLRDPCGGADPKSIVSLELLDILAGEENDMEATRTENGREKESQMTPAMSTPCTGSEEPDIEQSQPRLIFSEVIGPPSFVLDPVDLQKAEDLCRGKMGARVVFADSDMVVKFGHGVGLGEAEAMHLASTRTSIAVPKPINAYILDGVGYIVMSYEAGEPLEQYLDRVPKCDQDRTVQQLRNYVSQMRNITGDFIGGVDGSPCRDGIFEAGLGDYTKYSYGPYPNEASFNEGLVQALQDRLPKEFTVRTLKNHKIVFTHGDLHTGNIIVRADGTVVLLDWGLAGFWPEY
ncbi:kinase-like domain-containing protein [Penicillium brevicompactum]|uniref:Kinase-like domain-containing protein n=1 Tax=Penicillium brevicompactum TaxID=5074 RepID=A0A9W9RJ73_PENBR|nr:kinase-like domain-containing protein [Penicillium brevicompactum]